MNRTKLKIAAVQMPSVVGQNDENLARADAHARRAAARGVHLILFPELMPSGYSFSARIWSGAEPTHGRTVHWLLETARELGVHMGTSFMEAAGGDIYNTFVLAGPDGREAGRVQKRHVESYFFKGGTGPHVIDTEIGRLGVGICADNQYADLIPELQAADIDLMLMPHAWPVPFRTAKAVSESDIERSHKLAADMAPLYARALGVPAVFCNQAGPMSGDKGVGIVGRAMSSPNFHFPGLSTIAAADGSILARLGKEEDTAFAEVPLAPGKKIKTLPHAYGRWALPGSVFVRDVLFPIDAAAGQVWYALNPERKRAAQQAGS